MPTNNALRVVDLSRAPVTTLEVLPPYLTRLVLDDTAVESTRRLAPSGALSELSLTGSALVDLKGLARFPSLRQLNLAFTKLESLDDIPPLTELEVIDVRGLECRRTFATPEFPRLTQIIS